MNEPHKDDAVTVPTAPLTAEGAHEDQRTSGQSALARVAVLDILRGVALLGMFAVHFNYYEGTPVGAEPGRVAAFVEQFLGLFIEERFYAIFGMLFGVGFAVQLARADARGERFVARYLRRLAALAVFGLIAEGVFGFNVLFGYAMWGVPLLLLRRWPVRALVVVLVLCAASRPIYNLARVAIYSGRPDGMAQLAAANRERLASFNAARQEKERAEASTEWTTVVRARLGYMPKFHRQWSFLPGGSFTLFLLGIIAFRLGLFSRPAAHRKLIVALMIAGTASWVIEMWVLPIGDPPPPVLPDEGAVRTAFVTYARMNGFALFRGQWLAFAYVGAILLLVAHGKEWLRRLSPLAFAGRMALTNYMMQLILLEVLFTPKGFGLTVPASLVFPGAIALFALQVVLSRWWLSRFAAGPLEWIWRSFTYGRWQALRVVPAEGVAAMAPARGPWSPL